MTQIMCRQRVCQQRWRTSRRGEVDSPRLGNHCVPRRPEPHLQRRRRFRTSLWSSAALLPDLKTKIPSPRAPSVQGHLRETSCFTPSPMLLWLGHKIRTRGNKAPRPNQNQSPVHCRPQNKPGCREPSNHRAGGMRGTPAYGSPSSPSASWFRDNRPLWKQQKKKWGRRYASILSSNHVSD